VSLPSGHRRNRASIARASSRRQMSQGPLSLSRSGLSAGPLCCPLMALRVGRIAIRRCFATPKWCSWGNQSARHSMINRRSVPLYAAHAFIAQGGNLEMGGILRAGSLKMDVAQRTTPARSLPTIADDDFVVFISLDISTERIVGAWLLPHPTLVKPLQHWCEPSPGRLACRSY
jgi:hypothetical protein